MKNRISQVDGVYPSKKQFSGGKTCSGNYRTIKEKNIFIELLQQSQIKFIQYTPRKY